MIPNFLFLLLPYPLPRDGGGWMEHKKVGGMTEEHIASEARQYSGPGPEVVEVQKLTKK